MPFSRCRRRWQRCCCRPALKRNWCSACAGGMQLRHYDALNALTYRSEAWLSRRADLIIANAHAVRADAIARGLPADRIVVVPNGIDTDLMRLDKEAGRALRRTWGVS